MKRKATDPGREREQARLKRTPARCIDCGEYIELDRAITVRHCLRCAAPSAVAKVVGKFAEPGVWRIGPVVFDWDGTVSVVRCLQCPSYGEWRWGERIHRTAINHAKLWHGVDAEPHRILAPLRSVECERVGCSALVATSEDFPERLCVAHRQVAA